MTILKPSFLQLH